MTQIKKESGIVSMKIAGLRWWIVGMLFFAAVLNYVDKNTLALLAPTI